MSAPPYVHPRVADALLSRFRAGDSVEALAFDFVLTPEQVEHAICDAVRAECEAHKAGLLKEEENRCAT